MSSDEKRLAGRSIGFIGLGNMGGPMAGHLADAGARLRVFDVSPRAVEGLKGHSGVTPVASAGEAAEGVEVLFTVLPNDDIVKETYLGTGGIAGRGHAGLVTCDCSTVSPEATQAVHAALQGRGIHHLDTPMLGSKPQAISGEVFFIVAGDKAQLPKVAPMLEVMGRLHMYVGPSSTGNRIKLIHNVLGAANSAAVAESLALAVQAGVDPDVYRRVVIEGSGMAYTTYFGKRVERVLNGDYSTQFSLDLMSKDVRLALEIARRNGVEAPIMEHTSREYTAGQEAGWGAEDFSAVTHGMERKIGKKIRKR